MWQSANKMSSLQHNHNEIYPYFRPKYVYATRTHYIKLIRIIKYETSLSECLDPPKFIPDIRRLAIASK